MRISAVQKDTLFLLYAFELKQHAVVRQTVLFKIIRKQVRDVFPNNYSTSCRTLAANGLVMLERDGSQRLWLSLTEAGRNHAKVIYESREN